MSNRATKWIERSEESSNFYVVKTILGGMFVLICTCAMNEVGLYHVDKSLMRIATLIVCIVALFIEIYIHSFNHNSLPISKYVVLGATFVITLCETSTLSFFAVPLLAYPLLAATHYHSKRVNAYAITGSIICAGLSPYIGFYFHTWDLKYFLWIVHLIDSELIPMEYIEKGMAGTALADEFGITQFVAIPNVIYVSLLGILSFTVNLSRRKRQEREIKTILDMQDKMLSSMADIVENRDLSTGGHVKRTSGLVKIMSDYLKDNPVKSDGKYPTEDFYEAIVKGAPLHDLGKITISDIILCKPDKLTPEEFEQIKLHPGRSVTIINQVLGSIDDPFLLEITKNIALYHHEKYNGTGYPVGLSGATIPLEARIMAIADVYDALVSERCYKMPMSHEEAYKTIMESMGTHFDPTLAECFKASYPKFVEFYGG